MLACAATRGGIGASADYRCFVIESLSITTGSTPLQAHGCVLLLAQQRVLDSGHTVDAKTTVVTTSGG